MARQAFEAAWGAPVRLELQIPYHPQLALTEEPHIFRRRRGNLFEAYRLIERRLLAALNETAGARYQEIDKALSGGDYDAAAWNLPYMARLDGGEHYLSQITQLLIGYRSGPTRRNKAADALTENVLVTELESVLADEKGRHFVRLLIDHFPMNANSSNRFIARLCEADQDLAEALYERLTSKGDPDALVMYATFLADQRGDLRRAQDCYERAVAADPADLDVLSMYIEFLARRLHDYERAEALYKRTLETAPNLHAVRANFGQFLAGRGRLVEGENALLLTAEAVSGDFGNGNLAELFYSLWLVSSMLAKDAERWERRFKQLILQGFPRHPWSFEEMLQQAESYLSEDDLEYARALAQAFQEEDHVPGLEQLPRWRSIVPLQDWK